MIARGTHIPKVAPNQSLHCFIHAQCFVQPSSTASTATYLSIYHHRDHQEPSNYIDHCEYHMARPPGTQRRVLVEGNLNEEFVYIHSPADDDLAGVSAADDGGADMAMTMGLA